MLFNLRLADAIFILQLLLCNAICSLRLCMTKLVIYCLHSAILIRSYLEYDNKTY